MARFYQDENQNMTDRITARLYHIKNQIMAK